MARLMSFSLVVAVSACADDDRLSATLAVVGAPEIRLDTISLGVSGSVNALLRNTGTGSLQYESCSAQLQRLDRDDWVTAWSPGCPLLAPLVIIAPGDSLQYEIRVTTRLGSVAGGLWFGPVTGTFRISVMVAEDRAPRVRRSVSSPAFQF